MYLHFTKSPKNKVFLFFLFFPSDDRWLLPENRRDYYIPTKLLPLVGIRACQSLGFEKPQLGSCHEKHIQVSVTKKKDSRRAFRVMADEVLEAQRSV